MAHARQARLNLKRYVPAYVARIANKWARSSSRIYLARFGIGVNEWRVIARLAIEPKTSANQICAELILDKAAVSRSIRALERHRCIRLFDDPGDGRRRLIELTAKGLALHKKIVKIALAREQLLLASLKPAQINTLISLLERVDRNLVRMGDDAV